MKKVTVGLMFLGLAGCQGLLGTPPATTGWQFTVGTPAIVHVPVITDQSAAPTQTTPVGTHRTQHVPASPAVQAVPMIPVPKVVPQRGDCCDSPCRDDE